MERLWFKAKTYGWGWTPATWQGWLVLLVYICAVAASAVAFLRPHLGKTGWFAYGAALVLLSALLILTCCRTGEKPRWQWGDRGQG